MKCLKNYISLRFQSNIFFHAISIILELRESFFAT